MNGVHDAKRLAELTALPLDRKIQISQTRIIEWYTHYKGNVYVSFSGGKDSTVLLHLVRSIFPDVKAVFSNTGLEYPEIRQYATSYPNVDIVTPSMRFDQVVSTYGYPLIGKEVAEAIHYARKIHSQNSHVERERERERYRKRTELFGKRKKANIPQADGAFRQTSSEQGEREIAARFYSEGGERKHIGGVETSKGQDSESG